MGWTEDELIELYEERCAVREHDGGMCREQAESAAFTDWRKLVGPGVAAPEKIRQIVAAARSARRPEAWVFDGLENLNKES